MPCLPRMLAVSASVLTTVAMISGCAIVSSHREAPLPAKAVAKPPSIRAPAQRTSLLVDATASRQAIEGFGATINEYFNMATGEDLMGSLRPRVIEAVHGLVGITMGHLETGPYENLDPSRYATANDDGDPFTFSWSAFNFVRSEGQKAGIVDLARRHGFDNFTIHSGTNVRWSDPWMIGIRRADYRRYLDEMAENVVAPLVYWRDRFGVVTRWHHLFNEPTTGNRELAGGDVQEVVDLVKAVGARLRREGFRDMQLAVASEETEEASLATARAILADPEARRYVGAISYHTYPYGSIYSDVSRILATSGRGRPDAGRIRVRNQIRELARQYGLQVWMTEVSHGRANAFDTLIGRAIHIHDDLRYANALSYWAMYQAWDALARHGTCGEDCAVTFDRRLGTVAITGTGHAIGHYARWVRRGAVRVDSESDDPLILASAFRDDQQKRIIAVVINNHEEARALTLKVAGIAALADLKGEQSFAGGYWRALAAAALEEDGVVSIVLPPRSVTSLSASYR